MADVDGKSNKSKGIVFVDEGPAKRIADLIAVNGRDAEDIHYTNWCKYYDQDMVTLGFRGYDAAQKKAVDLITDKSAKILDFGCGTGKFGERMNSAGYTNIYGIDANKASFDKALGKNAYAKLENINISPENKAPYNDGYFDAVVALSVIGPNSVDQTILPEIDRLIKPGGYFISFLRKSRLLMERDDYNVKSVFEKWVSSGRWRRFPDDYSTYYSAGSELPEIEKEGVTITFQKV